MASKQLGIDAAPRLVTLESTLDTVSKPKVQNIFRRIKIYREDSSAF